MKNNFVIVPVNIALFFLLLLLLLLFYYKLLPGVKIEENNGAILLETFYDNSFMSLFVHVERENGRTIL